jgi:biopolymer transport protein ExbD
MREILGLVLMVMAMATGMQWADAAASAQTVRPGRIDVTVPVTYSQDRRVLLGSEQMSEEVLQQRLRQMAAPKNLLLHVAPSLTVGEVMDLMDRLKVAGAEQVGLAR